MLTIGEFSNICKVSTKTLRYYDEIGLIRPSKIDTENGYRYYQISQLETMLLINRLKSYQFSLEEIKELLQSKDEMEERLSIALLEKKKNIEKQAQELKQILEQLNQDIIVLQEGNSMMSYLDDIEVQLVEVPTMYLLSIRKMVRQDEFREAYQSCFGMLLQQIVADKLTIAAPPMVLFHSDEFTPLGLDTEFAIPIIEQTRKTKEFHPGLCLKTVLHGSYSGLSSVYTKQREYAEKEGYQNNGPLYECYMVDPSEVKSEKELVTEVYYPVIKKEGEKNER